MLSQPCINKFREINFTKNFRENDFTEKNNFQGAPIDAIGLQSHLHGQERVDINAIKYHVDLLWEEFKLPIWVTEFDWNADKSVDFGDHSYHAEQLENFYRLMFSHEVSISK